MYRSVDVSLGQGKLHTQGNLFRFVETRLKILSNAAKESEDESSIDQVSRDFDLPWINSNFMSVHSRTLSTFTLRKQDRGKKWLQKPVQCARTANERKRETLSSPENLLDLLHLRLTESTCHPVYVALCTCMYLWPAREAEEYAMKSLVTPVNYNSQQKATVVYNVFCKKMMLYYTLLYYIFIYHEDTSHNLVVIRNY